MLLQRLKYMILTVLMSIQKLRFMGLIISLFIIIIMR